MEKSNEDRLSSIRRYAKLLDSQFQIPGTKFKFGIDPILSLVPIIGSFSGLVTGMILVVLSHRQQVSGRVKMLMIRNVFIDYLLGLIPVLGNISDFVYKSNVKNLKLVEEHLLEGKHEGSGWKVFIGIVFVIILSLIISILLSLWLIKWLLASL